MRNGRRGGANRHRPGTGCGSGVGSGARAVFLALALFIFALLGMQLFAGQLGHPPPREASFDRLADALVTVFTVITGEVRSRDACMHAGRSRELTGFTVIAG